MKISNIIILIFLLSAFMIGTAFYQNGGDVEQIDLVIDNASFTIRNISLESNNSSSETAGILIIMEEYIHFIGILGMEVMRYGIHFGYDNPDYFEPSFIIKIIKLIIYLVIFSLLIQPIFYLLVFIVMAILWIIEKRKKKRKNISIESKKNIEGESTS